ncbi:amidohydrolase [Thermococcus barossii]|uniref:amidohydrolase n=1 Tax=Thermococcus barossii TaxID=54077 RepID=UPI0018E01CB5|nr:amidohydrolase [Thermococcus barossii]
MVCLKHAFINGNVYVSFRPVRRVEAFLVVDGKVAMLGSTEDILRTAGVLGAGVTDLGGRTVLPAFIDSHMHLDELGEYLNMLDLRGVRSIGELKEKLREFAEGRRGWLRGHGWDQELFEEKRWPTRWDLDEVVSDRPVMLSRVCLHAAVLNTKALEETGLIDWDSEDVIRDESGEPTGIVKEEAFSVAVRKFDEMIGEEEYAEYLLQVADYALSKGVTTVGFVSVGERALRALSRLEAEGKLRLRVRAYLNPGEELEVLESLERLGIRRGFGGGMLRINGVKVLADGSLGARTAWLSGPYSDADTSGHPNVGEEWLEAVAKRVHNAGLQMAVHAIGDATMDMVLDVYESLGDVERAGHRIEHASIMRPDQIERAKRLGVRLSVQPHFVLTDWWVIERVGEERAKWVYPFKSIAKAGIPFGLGTDSPVEPLDPWETVYAAVTRGKYENLPLAALTGDEALGLEETLHAYTAGSAQVLMDEELGTLEEGKLADFIVVSTDPFEVDEKELRRIRVLETYVGGERVFKA